MNPAKGIYKKKPNYNFLVPHNNEETESKETGSGDISHESSPYLIALSLGGRWLWWADPWLTGRKSPMRSVFAPRLGLSWMRAGLIRRSCMSHFTHTRWKGGKKKRHFKRSAISTFVRVCGLDLEHNHWAAGGEAAPSLLPAPAATLSAPSQPRRQCFGSAADQLLSQTWDSLVKDKNIYNYISAFIFMAARWQHNNKNVFKSERW